MERVHAMTRLVHVGASLFIGQLIFALTCTAVWAQSTAQISGTVKDQTAAVLPGVEVSMTQANIGLKRTSVTDET